MLLIILVLKIGKRFAVADDIINELATACTCGPLDADGACLPCCARKEIERLRRWKAEATTVLVEWDAVWECAGKGTLGESKQRGVVAELGRLDDEIERLRAAGDALADSVETALTGYSLDIYQTLPAWREARRG